MLLQSAMLRSGMERVTLGVSSNVNLTPMIFAESQKGQLVADV